MIAMDRLLAALQLGDSFFPSGATAFSFGLEGLRADGALGGAVAVEGFLAAQLEGRWVSGDRVALLHAHAAAGDLERIEEIDRLCDRSCWVESWRTAGRRLGRALLRVHQSLQTPNVEAYLARVEIGTAPGQLAPVQGLVSAGIGLAGDEAAALSGYGLAVSMVGAALRLGALGHLDAQRILARQRPRLAALVGAPLPPLGEMAAWVPGAEVASMRMEGRSGRLFAS
jgi:urease accessory protein